jgi:ribosomal protein S18 acetylase RimI-like enzyme
MTEHAVAMRPANADDARAIAGVHVRAWRSAYRGLMPDAFLDGLSLEERARGWRRRLEAHDAHTLVATENGAIVGFVTSGQSRDDAAAEGVTGEVLALYLDPAYIGRGLGCRLSDAALGALREAGFTTATLWVLEGNMLARRFYEAAGFEPDGARMNDARTAGVVLHKVRYRRSL